VSSRSRDTAIAVLARVSDRAPSEIQPEMDLVGDLGIDSPKALELLLELEEALGVEIADEEASGMDTVRDVLTFAERASDLGVEDGAT
jgi:acyl carrier protein